ncbi:MAG: hypothetical protein M3301_04030, partial [Chloroflexota bacterium]|nr:hypothetical protein [Chloroflexota bacterium]
RDAGALAPLLAVREPVNVTGKVLPDGAGKWQVAARTAADVSRVGLLVASPAFSPSSSSGRDGWSQGADPAPSGMAGAPALSVILLLAGASLFVGLAAPIARRLSRRGRHEERSSPAGEGEEPPAGWPRPA